jgi:nitroreductase
VGLPAGFFQRLVQAGSLAPSGDNLQPWSFEIDADKILVRHDARRDQSLFNVRQLASFIALGAVVENIAIAATKENLQAKVGYFPDAQDESLIARIDFEPGASVDPLVNFLESRCTNRKPYERRPLDIATRKQLDIDLTSYPGVEVSWVYHATDLSRIGKVVAKADRLLFENPLIHGHLFSTIRWNQVEVEKSRDGLPIETLELGKAGALGFSALKNWSVVNVLNRVGLSTIAARQSATLMRSSSAAALITATDPRPISFLHVGQAFQRLWLTATRHGLALQPMTAVIFLQLKSIVGDLEGLSSEQIAIANSLRYELLNVYGFAKERIPSMHLRLGYSGPPSGRTVRLSKLRCRCDAEN